MSYLGLQFPLQDACFSILISYLASSTLRVVIGTPMHQSWSDGHFLPDLSAQTAGAIHQSKNSPNLPPPIVPSTTVTPLYSNQYVPMTVWVPQTRLEGHYVSTRGSAHEFVPAYAIDSTVLRNTLSQNAPIFQPAGTRGPVKYRAPPNNMKSNRLENPHKGASGRDVKAHTNKQTKLNNFKSSASEQTNSILMSAKSSTDGKDLSMGPIQFGSFAPGSHITDFNESRSPRESASKIFTEPENTKALVTNGNNGLELNTLGIPGLPEHDSPGLPLIKSGRLGNWDGKVSRTDAESMLPDTPINRNLAELKSPIASAIPENNHNLQVDHPNLQLESPPLSASPSTDRVQFTKQVTEGADVKSTHVSQKKDALVKLGLTETLQGNKKGTHYKVDIFPTFKGAENKLVNSRNPPIQEDNTQMNSSQAGAFPNADEKISFFEPRKVIKNNTKNKFEGRPVDSVYNSFQILEPTQNELTPQSESELENQTIYLGPKGEAEHKDITVEETMPFLNSDDHESGKDDQIQETTNVKEKEGELEPIMSWGEDKKEREVLDSHNKIRRKKNKKSKKAKKKKSVQKYFSSSDKKGPSNRDQPSDKDQPSDTDQPSDQDKQEGKLTILKKSEEKIKHDLPDTSKNKIEIIPKSGEEVKIIAKPFLSDKRKNLLEKEEVILNHSKENGSEIPTENIANMVGNIAEFFRRIKYEASSSFDETVHEHGRIASKSSKKKYFGHKTSQCPFGTNFSTGVTTREFARFADNLLEGFDESGENPKQLLI